MDSKQIIKELKKYHNQKNIDGMKRFGITGNNIIGGPGIPALRKMAKQIGKDHKLAKELWDSEIHEARILAGFIDDPNLVTEDQMDEWADGFDSWDLCDQVCSNLFDKTIYSKKKILQWTMDEREFMKRAGFVLIAAAAVHDKKAKDRTFIKYLSIIKKHSNDNRNFVRKAVNWTLRQVGKRNNALKAAAIKTAGNILAQDTDASRWIARDALRELRNK
jgi:3-methyladenine DNA glycosylase AlkD